MIVCPGSEELLQKWKCEFTIMKALHTWSSDNGWACDMLTVVAVSCLLSMELDGVDR